MASSQVPNYVDQGGSVLGTPLRSESLNTSVSAASCLITTTSIPVVGTTLSYTQPLTEVILNTNGALVYVAAPSQTLVLTASTTNYVDIFDSGAGVGTYNVGTSSTLVAGRVRLFSCVTNLTQITAVTQVTPFLPIPQDNIQADSTESVAITAPNMSSNNSLLANLNRIRSAITMLTSTNWTNAVANTKAAILNDGTNSAATVSLAGKLQLNTTPTASSSTGLLNLGGGSFAGGGAPAFNSFVGGTTIAINLAAGNGASLFTAQKAGVQILAIDNLGTTVSTGSIQYSAAPTASGGIATATFGNGPMTTGNGAGTLVAGLAATGYTGDMLNFLLNDVSQFKIDAFGHLIAGGATIPTPAGGSSTVTGTSPTIAVVRGNDTAGYINFTAGTGPSAAGVALTFTFNHNYAAAPKAVLLFGVVPFFTAGGFYVSNPSVSGFQVAAGNILTSSLSYAFFYLVIG